MVIFQNVSGPRKGTETCVLNEGVFRFALLVATRSVRPRQGRASKHSTGR
jgi:hypothetical protein